MIGRAALGNPWIFRQLRAAHEGRDELEGPTPSERAELIAKHFDAHCMHHEGELRAVRKFRQHLIWYSRGLRGASDFREGAVRIDEKTAVTELIHSYFGSANLVSEAADFEYDERKALG